MVDRTGSKGDGKKKILLRAKITGRRVETLSPTPSKDTIHRKKTSFIQYGWDLSHCRLSVTADNSCNMCQSLHCPK